MSEGPVLNKQPETLADDDQAERLERRRQAMASAALEGVEFSAEYLAELEQFDRDKLTCDERAAYLIKKHQRG